MRSWHIAFNRIGVCLIGFNNRHVLAKLDLIKRAALLPLGRLGPLLYSVPRRPGPEGKGQLAFNLISRVGALAHHQ